MSNWSWMIKNGDVWRRLPSGDLCRQDMIPIRVLAGLEDRTESAVRQQMSRAGIRAYNGCINYRKYKEKSEGVEV